MRVGVKAAGCAVWRRAAAGPHGLRRKRPPRRTRLTRKYPMRVCVKAAGLARTGVEAAGCAVWRRAAAGPHGLRRKFPHAGRC
jgi:hypothetical protein